ncbi:MAG: hypothetical protein ACLQDL_01115 [Spirochaetia bacterium]
MRRTKKPTEDSQDVQDEAFLRQHSPHPSTVAISLGQVREELVKELELARAGAKAVDPTARAFSLGTVSGIEGALKLIEKALQMERAERITAAATGHEGRAAT